MTFVKRMAVGTAAMLIGLSAPSAQAGYVVDLTQQGSNVVATGRGPIDLAGLSFYASCTCMAGLGPGFGTGPINAIGTGALVEVDDAYSGFTGPTSFGFGSFVYPNSGSGDLVILDETVGVLDVPAAYVSGSALTSTSTYDGATLTSLGVTPGTYKWTWGTGPNQNFTLVIGTTGAVPEVSTWAMMLLGFAGLSFLGYRKARKDPTFAT